MYFIFSMLLLCNLSFSVKMSKQDFSLYALCLYVVMHCVLRTLYKLTVRQVRGSGWWEKAGVIYKEFEDVFLAVVSIRSKAGIGLASQPSHSLWTTLMHVCTCYNNLNKLDEFLRCRCWCNDNKRCWYIGVTPLKAHYFVWILNYSLNAIS